MITKSSLTARERVKDLIVNSNTRRRSDESVINPTLQKQEKKPTALGQWPA